MEGYSSTSESHTVLHTNDNHDNINWMLTGTLNLGPKIPGFWKSWTLTNLDLKKSCSRHMLPLINMGFQK